ncbi:unnamed protein product [Polarella glacialis]|uniref:Uncharacterized protein n=1 Tax=Polarella glacialis TaxID=89957 RepID=A0A813FSI1_POLGL|nr:unnamed protein product [Polarella glacialis]
MLICLLSMGDTCYGVSLPWDLSRCIVKSFTITTDIRFHSQLPLLLYHLSCSKTADKETVGFRVLNTLYGPLRARGHPEPEHAHPSAATKLHNSRLSGTPNTTTKNNDNNKKKNYLYLAATRFTTSRACSGAIIPARWRVLASWALR